MTALSEITQDRIDRARAMAPEAFQAPLRTRLARAATWAVLIGLTAYTLVDFNFSPQRIWLGLGQLGHVMSFMFPPYLWEEWDLFMEPVIAIGETLAMAFLGTLLGAMVAFPLGFLGAKNIMPVEWFRLLSRRGFDIVRAFETLVLALIFIRAFGLGPLAGIFAIAVSEVGTLSKLFAEAIENTERRQVEGVRAAGADRPQSIRFAVLPQVLPVMLSNVLYQFESNTRSATILGIVGAGGIGFLLYDRIRINAWPEVMSIVILILITVYMIDNLSAWLRMKIIGRTETAA